MAAIITFDPTTGLSADPNSLLSSATDPFLVDSNTAMSMDPSGMMSLSALSSKFTNTLLSPPASVSPPESTHTASSTTSDDVLMTPTTNSPSSNNSSPSSNTTNSNSGESNTFISVSTTFYPGANLSNEPVPTPTDLVIISSDQVFFYVHTHCLLADSNNGFNLLLPISPKHASSKHSSSSSAPSPSNTNSDSSLPDSILHLPESSSIINITLHTIYNISCTHYLPPLSDLSQSVATLKRYGYPLHSYISPQHPSALFQHILSHAPIQPIQVYTLASMYDLHDLAVSSSPHLLSFPLHTLTDEMAVEIGPVYLKKLFFLHLGRTDALKRILLPPPHPHAPTPTCDFVEQKKLTRAWALASAYLTWDARPDTSAGMMESALKPLGEHLTCELCQEALRERIRSLVVQWTVVKRTI